MATLDADDLAAIAALTIAAVTEVGSVTGAVGSIGPAGINNAAFDDDVASISDVVDAMEAGDVAVLLQKWFLNKLVRTDNEDGTITYVLYDDDNSTPLKTWVYTTATETRAKAS